MLKVLVVLLVALNAASLSAFPLKGDINEDGKVNIFDVLGLLDIISGQKQETSSELAAFVEQVNRIYGITLKQIPAGSFFMGDSGATEPQYSDLNVEEYQVTLDAFLISATEITQATGTRPPPAQGPSLVDSGLCLCRNATWPRGGP